MKMYISGNPLFTAFSAVSSSLPLKFNIQIAPVEMTKNALTDLEKHVS